MRQFYYIAIIGVLVSILLSCNSNTKKEISSSSDSLTNNKIEKAEAPSWQNNFDFDGDKKIDSIKYNYSGGAHCCYTILVRSSLKDSLYKFSNEIEGGYIIFDLSNPAQFDIKNCDSDSLPELFYGKLEGVRKNPVFIDFDEGDFRTVVMKP
jgi:hypothetical protein